MIAIHFFTRALLDRRSHGGVSDPPINPRRWSRKCTEQVAHRVVACRWLARHGSAMRTATVRPLQQTRN